MFRNNKEVKKWDCPLYFLFKPGFIEGNKKPTEHEITELLSDLMEYSYCGETNDKR